jgi:NAD(P)-dependent dehydrogenase (short-subunit alcohol dehydrogenase family)
MGIKMQSPGNALIIDGSDGIGLALTRKLLNRRWNVTGLSRSPSHLIYKVYSHSVIFTEDESFALTLTSVLFTTRIPT